MTTATGASPGLALELPLVFVVGPFPPPVHGLAVVTAAVAQALATRAAVRRFNVTGPGAGATNVGHRLRRAWALTQLWRQMRRAMSAQRPAALLISCSAGGVMLFDALVARLATHAGVPVHVHHHSFAYLDAQSLRWIHRAAVALMRQQRHIVLCPEMAHLLSQRHHVTASHIVVLSNAAFVPTSTVARQQRTGSVLRLGFLSNITQSKGIFEFFDLIERLRSAGHAVVALIAGPLDRSIKRRFTDRLTRSGFAEHLGALDDAGKAAFFAHIDLLVLPSRHVHEAEPLVMIEALAHGVPVLATRRGCLPTAWADTRAVHVVDETAFAEQACAALAPWLDSEAVRRDWSDAAIDRHVRMRNRALKQWQGFADALCGQSR